MNDPVSWYSMVNTGALSAFAVFVMYALWRIGSIGGKELFTLARRHVENTENLISTLSHSDAEQRLLCEAHRSNLSMMMESIEENTVVQQEQCDHLKVLVDLHQSPSGAVNHSIAETHGLSKDMHRMKRAAVRACEMCRTIANVEFPNSAPQIDQHCQEIERLIQDSGEINLKDLS